MTERRVKASESTISLTCKRLEVHDFEVFFVVGEVGSFRKAATCLNIGQSAVTRRIQKLEEALGVSLFERSSTGARLTTAGKNFAIRSRHLIQDLKCAIRSAQSAGQGSKGQLQIAQIASLSQGVLRQIVVDFVSEHPEVEISFTECDRGELLTMLSHRLIDVVFAAGAPPSQHGEMLHVAEEPIYLAVSNNHFLAKLAHVRWNDICEQTFLTSTEEPGPEIREYIISRIGKLGRHTNVVQHRLDREGIMNLVGLGFGVSVVADHWRGTSYPDVDFIPIIRQERQECIPFSLTWRPENDNPALRRFLSLARVHAKAHAAPS